MARDFRARFEQNVRNVIARLYQETGKISKAANDQMEREAREIHRIAVDLTPVDTGALESAVKVDSHDRRRRWQVYVDASVVDQRDGTAVGEYAVRVHEWTHEDIEWGPKTRAKGHGAEPAGSKFLHRAYRMRVKGFTARVREAAQRGVSGASR